MPRAHLVPPSSGRRQRLTAFVDRTAAYHVVSHWSVAASVDEVARIFRDVESLPRWWPAVFLDATVLRPGGENEVGLRTRLHTKGWLPYTLRLAFTIVDPPEPDAFALTVDGDLEGGCVCHAVERDGNVHLQFDWRVRARKPLVRYMSPLFKRWFTANHRWVMARGQESLAIEIARRRRGRAEGAAAVAAPRGPTFPYTPLLRPVMKWLERTVLPA